MSSNEPIDGSTPQDPTKERFTSPIDPTLEDELADKRLERERIETMGPGNEHPEGVIDISGYPEGAEPPTIKDNTGREVKIMTPAERERLRTEDPEAYRRLTQEERDSDKDYRQ